jgi:hypothetical protein
MTNPDISAEAKGHSKQIDRLKSRGELPGKKNPHGEEKNLGNAVGGHKIGYQ